ncbi:MAG TPA: hypothetical protein VMD57_05690, partial [Candidatus Baltobacteraceae bacterium]|nr:hypothetical protein [Candidatus Baltobacteraceae bacterium]
MLAKFEPVGLIKDCGIETHFAVAVTVEIPETNVTGIGNLYRVRKWLIRTDDAITVKIRKGDITRGIDFNGQAKSTFAAFFFGLQRVNAP